MKASELRIGNYLQHPERGLIIVRGIETDFDDLNRENTVNDFAVSELLPVPLTEEWLLKFGFKDDEPHTYINLDEHSVMSIQFDQYKKIISLFSAGAHYYLLEIKYVHQLQNLYFSLTGQDLEFKE